MIDVSDIIDFLKSENIDKGKDLNTIRIVKIDETYVTINYLTIDLQKSRASAIPIESLRPYIRNNKIDIIIE